MHIPAVYTRGTNIGQCENCGILLGAPRAVRTHGCLVACLACHFVHVLTHVNGAWTADALMCSADPSGACDDVGYCPLLSTDEQYATVSPCPYTPWHRATTQAQPTTAATN